MYINYSVLLNILFRGEKLIFAFFVENGEFL